jgi:hypothetical protein
MKSHITPRHIVSAIVLGTLLISFGGTASAAILFQDDTFDEVMSDAIMIGSNDAGTVNNAIQFGANPIPSENGNITWNIATNNFTIDHTVDVTGGLSATGNVNFSGSTQTRIRENSSPNTLAACANLGEIILNTGTNVIQVCTTVGVAGVAVWTDMPVTYAATAGNAATADYATDAGTVGGLSNTSFLRSDADSNLLTGNTLTTDAGSTLVVNGILDASGATRLAVPSGGTNPLTCTEGDLFYNTSALEHILYVCTTTDTWTAAGPQDFEAVYAKDSDKILTTGIGTFGITSTNTTGTAINLQAVTGAGGVTIGAGTGGLNFNSAGLFALGGAADSTITTTGASDITITAGDDLFFDDAQLTSAIQLTNTATGWAATLTGGGIVDNINSFTLTTAGDGASNVGLEAGSLTNVTPATNDVQAALVALDAKVGSGGANVDTLVFYPEFPDAVIFSDPATPGHNGTLTADYDDTNKQHYYQWTTNNAALQNIDVRFRFPLPTDFVSVGSFTGAFRTGTATAADNKVDFTLSDSTTNATCATSLANNNVAWTDTVVAAGTINAGCVTLTAGDIMEVAAKLYDISGATTWAQVGRVILGYNN